MSFELQFSAEVFGRIVRNRLRRQVNLCIDQSFDSPVGSLVIDHIDIADQTTVQREKRLNSAGAEVDSASQIVWILLPTNYYSMTVPFLQIKQAVDIFLVKESDLEANGAAPSAPFLTQRVFPTFNVSAYTDNQTQGGSNRVTLTYQLAYIDYGVASAALTPAQKQDLENLMSGLPLSSITVDMGAISGVGDLADGGSLNIVNTGIACDPAGTFVALRLESDIYASPVKLEQAFFTAGPVDHLNGLDWALHVDEDVILTGARAQAATSLVAIDKIRVRSGPDVAWDPSGPAIRVTAAIEAIDACPFFVENIDLDVDLAIRTSFAVNTSGTLTTRTTFGGTPSNFVEEVGCAVTAGLLWPFIVPLMLEHHGVSAKAALPVYFAGLWVPFLVRAAAVIFAIEAFNSGAAAPVGDNCRRINDDTIDCDDTFDVGMVLVPPFRSRFRLDQIAGRPSGLILRGTIENLRDAAVGSVAIANTPLVWTVWGSCRGGYGIVNQSQIEVKIEGTDEDLICGARIVSDDPLTAYSISRYENYLNVRAQFPDAAASYGCKVRVVTRRGVRTITLAGPSAIGDAERETLERLIHNIETNVCQAFRDTFHERENRNWGLDDPIDQREIIHSWEAVIHELAPGTTVTVSTSQGDLVMEAVSSAQGVAQIATMFEGHESPSALVLERAGTAAMPAVITTRQTEFERRHSFVTNGEVSAMEFSIAASGARLLTITDAQRISTWDVSSTQAPLFLGSSVAAKLSAQGLAGANAERLGSAAKFSARLNELGYGIRDIKLPRIAGARHTALASDSKQHVLFDVSDPDTPKRLVTYHRKPWFDGSVASGKLLAKARPGENRVDLYFATKSAKDGELLEAQTRKG
jgi:hypothetical protein